MNKKVLKIGFHSAVSKDARKDFFNLLSVRFEPYIAEDYDYYIANEAIYWSHENMREFVNSNVDSIRIFGCGEAVYPDLNLFDYAIWHVNHYMVGDRIIYDPLIRTEVGYMIDHVEEIDHTKDEVGLEKILLKKERFCNFMYANSRAHMMRDKLFYEISKYKKVDSLGRHLKNVDIEDTRDIIGWEKKSIELKRKYKFSIAAENACFPGYTSEKIMTSMLANSIPIYWGDPCVGEEFNEESFINVNKFCSMESLIAKIKELDQDIDAYKEMLAKPWRTAEQIKKCQNAIDAFPPAVFHIFEQDKRDAVRRPRGCWPDVIYSKFMRFEGK